MLAKSIVIAYLVMWAVGALSIIGSIGKPKQPTTPALAAFAISLIATEIVGAVYVLNQL